MGESKSECPGTGDYPSTAFLVMLIEIFSLLQLQHIVYIGVKQMHCEISDHYNHLLFRY